MAETCFTPPPSFREETVASTENSGYCWSVPLFCHTAQSCPFCHNSEKCEAQSATWHHPTYPVFLTPSVWKVTRWNTLKVRNNTLTVGSIYNAPPILREEQKNPFWKKGGGKWILCHPMPLIWRPLLPVKMSDEFTVREVYFKFKWNNYCELGGANEFFLRVDPFY